MREVSAYGWTQSLRQLAQFEGWWPNDTESASDRTSTGTVTMAVVRWQHDNTENA